MYKHYNIIPDNIEASKTKIKSFRITLGEHIHILAFNASYDASTSLNWKRIKELCQQYSINFKNQTFVQFIKQLRDNFINEQSDRNNFSTIDRKKLFQKYNNKCAICKCITDEFEIDHIKPLSANGTNHIDNLQPLCKSCHKQKTKQ